MSILDGDDLANNAFALGAVEGALTVNGLTDSERVNLALDYLARHRELREERYERLLGGAS